MRGLFGPEKRGLYYRIFHSNISEEITCELLANLAIASILSDAGENGLDGLRYLKSVKKMGVITPLSESYEREILNKSKCNALEEAIDLYDRQRRGF